MRCAIHNKGMKVHVYYLHCSECRRRKNMKQ